jgi:hypothetical protein
MIRFGEELEEELLEAEESSWFVVSFGEESSCEMGCCCLLTVQLLLQWVTRDVLGPLLLVLDGNFDRVPGRSVNDVERDTSCSSRSVGAVYRRRLDADLMMRDWIFGEGEVRGGSCKRARHLSKIFKIQYLSLIFRYFKCFTLLMFYLVDIILLSIGTESLATY